MSKPKKSWLDSTTPLIAISAVPSSEPVRGHSALAGKRVRATGRCFGTRKNHSWVDGRCWWCNQPRNAK